MIVRYGVFIIEREEEGGGEGEGEEELRRRLYIRRCREGKRWRLVKYLKISVVFCVCLVVVCWMI